MTHFCDLDSHVDVNSPIRMDLFRAHLYSALPGIAFAFPRSDGAGARLVLTADVLRVPIWRRQGHKQKMHASHGGRSLLDIREAHVMVVRVARESALDAPGGDGSGRIGGRIGGTRQACGGAPLSSRVSSPVVSLTAPASLEKHLWEQLNIYPQRALKHTTTTTTTTTTATMGKGSSVYPPALSKALEQFRRAADSQASDSSNNNDDGGGSSGSNDNSALRELLRESFLRPPRAAEADACYSNIFSVVHDKKSGVVYVVMEHIGMTLERLLLYDPSALYGGSGPHLSNPRVRRHNGTAPYGFGKNSAMPEARTVPRHGAGESGDMINFDDTDFASASRLLEGSITLDDETRLLIHRGSTSATMPPSPLGTRRMDGQISSSLSSSSSSSSSSALAGSSSTIGVCFGTVSQHETRSLVGGGSVGLSSDSLRGMGGGASDQSQNAIARVQFIIYQLLSAIDCLHTQGIVHGSLSPRTIYIADLIWVKIHPAVASVRATVPGTHANNGLDAAGINANNGGHFPWPSSRVFDRGMGSPYAGMRRGNLHTITERWRQGDISNFEYLMLLNDASGRRMGDASFCPVLPWVTDFVKAENVNAESLTPAAATLSGWNLRDLTRSKFRLKKGDAQLDVTYQSALQQGMQHLGLVPHHIPENLTDITFYNYLARVTPIEVLRSVVRANFTSRHYPTSMQHLYDLTPDECIPEFYLDSSVFKSVHTAKAKTRTGGKSGSDGADWNSDDPLMPDLALPENCVSPSEFIARHRALLESDQVSEHLHSWIDLNFGFKLTGDAAVKSKNVPLNVSSAVDSVTLSSIHRRHEGASSMQSGAGSMGPASLTSNAASIPSSAGSRLYKRPRHLVGGAGFVQLFARPHPRRFKRVQVVAGNEPDRHKEVPLYTSTTTRIQPNLSPSAINSRAYLDRGDTTGARLLRDLPFPCLRLESSPSPRPRRVLGHHQIPPTQSPSSPFFSQSRQLPSSPSPTGRYADHEIVARNRAATSTGTANGPIGSLMLDMGRPAIMTGDAWDFLGDFADDADDLESKDRGSNTPGLAFEGIDESSGTNNASGSDHHGAYSQQLEATYSAPKNKKNNRQAAADDLFSVGCVIAQLYLPKNGPLFTHKSLDAFEQACRERAYQSSDKEPPSLKTHAENHPVSSEPGKVLTLLEIQECLVKACGQGLHMMPPHVLMTVVALVQPNASKRPSASLLISGASFNVPGGSKPVHCLNQGASTRVGIYAQRHQALFHDPTSHRDLYQFLSRWYSRSNWRQRYIIAWTFLPSLVETLPRDLFEGIVIPYVIDLLGSRTLVSAAAANAENSKSGQRVPQSKVLAELKECADIALALWVLCARRGGSEGARSQVLWGAIRNLLDTSMREAEDAHEEEIEAGHSPVGHMELPSTLAAIAALCSLANMGSLSSVSALSSKAHARHAAGKRAVGRHVGKPVRKDEDGTSATKDAVLPPEHKVKLYEMGGFIIPCIECVGREFFLSEMFSSLLEMVTKLKAKSCIRVRCCAADVLAQLASKQCMSCELVIRFMLRPILRHFGQNVQNGNAMFETMRSPRMFVPVRPYSTATKAWARLSTDGGGDAVLHHFAEPRPPSFLIAEILVGLSQQLGEAAAVRYLLPPAFGALPPLFRSFQERHAYLELQDDMDEDGENKIDMSVGAPILESLQVLYDMIPVLSPRTVFDCYVMSPPPTSRGLTLHAMLERMPFPSPLVYRESGEAHGRTSRSASAASLKSTSSSSMAAESSASTSALPPMPHVQSVLARIVVRICERIGRKHASEYIVPCVHRLLQRLSTEVLPSGALARWETSAPSKSISMAPMMDINVTNKARRRRPSFVRSDLHEAAAAAAASTADEIHRNGDGSTHLSQYLSNRQHTKVATLYEQRLIVERVLDYAGMLYFPLAKLVGSQKLRSQINDVDAAFIQAMYFRHDDLQRNREKYHGTYFSSRRETESKGDASNTGGSNMSTNSEHVGDLGESTELLVKPSYLKKQLNRDVAWTNSRGDTKNADRTSSSNHAQAGKGSSTGQEHDGGMRLRSASRDTSHERDTEMVSDLSVGQGLGPGEGAAGHLSGGVTKPGVGVAALNKSTSGGDIGVGGGGDSHMLDVPDLSIEPQRIELMQMTGRTMVTPGGFIAPDWRVMRRIKRKQEKQEKKRKKQTRLEAMRLQEEQEAEAGKHDSEEAEKDGGVEQPGSEGISESQPSFLSRRSEVQGMPLAGARLTDMSAESQEFLGRPTRGTAESREFLQDDIISDEDEDENEDEDEDKYEDEAEAEDKYAEEDEDEDEDKADGGVKTEAPLGQPDVKPSELSAEAPGTEAVTATANTIAVALPLATAISRDTTEDMDSDNTGPATAVATAATATAAAAVLVAANATNDPRISGTSAVASAEIKRTPKRKERDQRQKRTPPISATKRERFASEMQPTKKGNNSDWWRRGAFGSNSSIWLFDKRSEAEYCGGKLLPGAAWPQKRRQGQPVFCVHSFSATTYGARANKAGASGGTMHASSDATSLRSEVDNSHMMDETDKGVIRNVSKDSPSGMSLDNGEKDARSLNLINANKSREPSDAPAYALGPAPSAAANVRDGRHLKLGVRKMLVDSNESVLATGSQGGGLRIFSLGSGKPTASHQSTVGSSPVFDLAFAGAQNTLVACDGGLHVFDMQAGKFSMRLPFDNSTNAMRKGTSFTAVSPLTAGWYSGCGAGINCPSIVAATAGGNLACLDLRMQISRGGVRSRFHTRVAAEWSLAPQAQMKHIGDNGRITAMTTSSHREWVAVASASGFVTIVDQRNGSVLHRWQAHSHLHDAFGFSSPSFSAPSAEVFNVGSAASGTSSASIDPTRMSTGSSSSASLASGGGGSVGGGGVGGVRSGGASSGLWSSGSPIVKMVEVSRGVLLTASADRTAMIWDLRASAPVLVQANRAAPMSAADASDVSAVVDAKMLGGGMRVTEKGVHSGLVGSVGLVRGQASESKSSLESRRNAGEGGRGDGGGSSGGGGGGGGGG